MKTYKYKSKQCGFQISIPEDWSESLMVDLNSSPQNLPGKNSVSKTILGPLGKFLHILITQLSENESEPTIHDISEYFDGLTYRQNLHVIATGIINIENKEHFWATYYRMTLIGQRQLQFFKKYSLFLNRTEYLITAGLWDASLYGKEPTDQQLQENEEIYDIIVSSFKLLNK